MFQQEEFIERIDEDEIEEDGELMKMK